MWLLLLCRSLLHKFNEGRYSGRRVAAWQSLVGDKNRAHAT
jgi:hypothetical protein